MTDLIQEVREALAKATPGPWESYIEWSDSPIVFQEGAPGDKWVCQLWYKDEEVMDNGVNNAHLIANAPTWLQQLTDRLEAAERELDEAVKALEWYGNHKNYEQDVVECDISSPIDVYYESPNVLEDAGALARTVIQTIKSTS